MSAQTELKISTEAFLAFVNQPENAEKFFELHEGEIVEMPSPILLHALIVAQLVYLIRRFLEQFPLGVVVGDNCDFLITENTVLRPDVAYIQHERISSLPKYLSGAPDLAVEVVSPSNSAKEIAFKVESYLKHGSHIVWTVYPEDKTVRVHTRVENGILTRTLTGESPLDAGAALPGFSVPVSAVFPAIPEEAQTPPQAQG